MMSSNSDIPTPESSGVKTQEHVELKQEVSISSTVVVLDDMSDEANANPPIPENERTSSTITTSSSSACTTPSPSKDPCTSEPISKVVTKINVANRKTMACEMCNNYEIQLQDVQYKETVLNLQLAQHEKTIKQLKDDLKKEQNFRRDLEDKYNEEAKKSEKEIRKLSIHVDESRIFINKITDNFNLMEKRATDLVSDLIGQIEHLKKEIKRLSIDNEKLLGKHMKKSQELFSESISLPQESEQIQFYCLKLREDLIQTLASKEHIEEELKSEIMFLKEQLKGEVQAKENMEENYSQENDMLRSKYDVKEVELIDTQFRLNELQKELDILKENYSSLSHNSTQKIVDLESQLEKLSEFKSKADGDIFALKNKVQSLQVELDNSEAVQRDFVKLSQSLQVQLEKIRQADTDVRWQHEEDAIECNSCKKVFHSRKEKVNCSHCGRIFCPECTSKIVFSGPKRRPFKVCNVCHTLLDNQTACWFVNEAPSSPT